jgi:hypothetical protein
MDTFVASNQTSSSEMFRWQLEDITYLQATFYQKNLPAIEDPIEFVVKTPPHLLESGKATCYFFSASGKYLAELYAKHREPLLQRNIRSDQGPTVTNRAIFSSCTGGGSADFIHFNNGVSFLADNVTWDPIRQRVTLTKKSNRKWWSDS